MLLFIFLCFIHFSEEFNFSCFNFFQDISLYNGRQTPIKAQDIVLKIDTKTHFETDELDCDNFHIVERTRNDTNGFIENSLEYYFESGCGKSSETNVWVTLTELGGNRTIYLRVYYGNRETLQECKNVEQPDPDRVLFNGSFVVMSASISCPSGWTKEEKMLEGHHPIMASSLDYGYYDSTDDYNHTHIYNNWIPQEYTAIAESGSSSSGPCHISDDNHIHRYMLLTNFGRRIEVPYLELTFCKRNTLDLSQNSVIVVQSHLGYNSSSNLERFSELDDKFPRAGTYPNTGGGGGSVGHTHTWEEFYTFNINDLKEIDYPTVNNETFAAYPHDHKVLSGTTGGSTTDYPPFSKVMFAKTTYDGVFTDINREMLFFASYLPPKGWKVELEYENEFLVGSDDEVATGFGDGTHTHQFTAQFVSGYMPRNCRASSSDRSTWDHGHPDHTTSFPPRPNTLPYVVMYHIKRKGVPEDIIIEYSDVVRREEKQEEEEFDLMFYIYIGLGALLLIVLLCIVCVVFCVCACLTKKTKKNGTEEEGRKRASGFNGLLKSIDEIKEDELLEMSDGKPKSFKQKKPKLKEITIDFNEIDTGVKIHQSFLSSYYESEWNNKKVLYRFFDHNVIQEEDFPKMREEMNVIRGIKHNSVLQFHGFTSLPNAGVVCEYIPKSLKNHIIKTQDLEFKAKVKIIKQIAMLMFFLQGKGIVNHLSIDSIFVNEKNEVKVAIEFVKSLKKFFTKDYVCNNRYSSPELVDHVSKEGLGRKELREEHRKLLKQKMQSKIGGKKEDLFKREVYSFGILMFEIVTGSFDYYKGKSEEELREPPKLKKEKYFANWFVNLYKMCLKESPQERPNFERICNFLDSIPE